MIPTGPRTAADWSTHPMALAMTEAALLANLVGTRRDVGLLQAFGWSLVHHETDSRRTKAGFLDVCAVRPSDGRLLFAELKSQTGRIRPGQRLWLQGLEAVETMTSGRVIVRLWRPSDWLSGDVERVLR